MERGVREFMRLFEQESDFILRQSTEGVVTRLGAKSATVLKRSPVDKGDFVRDWDVAIGSWPSDTKPQPDPKKQTTAKRLRATIRKVKFGQSIFFENTDPAARPLEFGSSKQAPNGIVRLAGRSWRKQVQNAGRAALRKARKRLDFK